MVILVVKEEILFFAFTCIETLPIIAMYTVSLNTSVSSI
jgi:hypothetical protein